MKHYEVSWPLFSSVISTYSVLGTAVLLDCQSCWTVSPEQEQPLRVSVFPLQFCWTVSPEQEQPLRVSVFPLQFSNYR